MTNARRAAVRVRRSPHLVLYWRHNQLIARNYATGAIAVVPAFVCDVLHACAGWTNPREIARGLPFLQPADVRRLIRQLVTRSLLQQSDRPEDPRERGMRAFAAWNPEAGFFHTATKDVRFWTPQQAARAARAHSADSPMPPPVKRYRGVPTIDLPRADPGDEFGRIARARRTWRRFAADPVTVEELAAVLGLSVGVQKWVRIGGRELPLKTSPSGGARHPVEAYVVVRRVRGLAAGIYHYHGGRHVLERLRRVPSRERIRSYLPFSEHATSASALVLFTAMFERQLWRYPYSRAYRAAFIEAGHVCQTFCLAATALGLAPFSIMALADSLIERDLGLDGITESVLYAAGVGRPPARASWAPRLRGTPPVRPNPHLRTKSE